MSRSRIAGMTLAGFLIGAMTLALAAPQPQNAKAPPDRTADRLTTGAVTLGPVAADSISTPLAGKTLFVDAGTGKLSLKDTTGAVVVLEPTVKPPDPIPIPPNPTPEPADRQLLGGWRVPNEFGRGCFAVDWATKTLAMGGHSQRNEILLFDLPAMGTGTDSKQWPIAKLRAVVPGWWTADCYPSGVAFWKGDWWVSARKFYDMAPPGDQTWFSRGGLRITFPVARQVYHGMVKKFGQDPWPGGGGYESGQGSAFGPALADPAGNKRIAYDFTGTWETRAPREPNYFADVDSWVAINPRMVNGVKEGRWCCDRIRGGGLITADGVRFWVQTGIDKIDYALQNDVFSKTEKCYEHVYDPLTYKLKGWREVPYGIVQGQEFGPAGEIILSHGNAWASGAYQVDPIVAVYSNTSAATQLQRPKLLDPKPDPKK